MSYPRQRAAFSLLELLAVVIILGVIASVVIGRIHMTGVASKEYGCLRNKAEINAAIERYYFENGAWPSDISVIAASATFPEGLPLCPVSNAAYSLDDTTHRISGHASGSH